MRNNRWYLRTRSFLPALISRTVTSLSYRDPALRMMEMLRSNLISYLVIHATFLFFSQSYFIFNPTPAPLFFFFFNQSNVFFCFFFMWRCLEKVSERCTETIRPLQMKHSFPLVWVKAPFFFKWDNPPPPPQFPVSFDLYYTYTLSTTSPISTSADKNGALWDRGGSPSTSPNILFHSSLALVPPFFPFLPASLSLLCCRRTFIPALQKPGPALLFRAP